MSDGAAPPVITGFEWLFDSWHQIVTDLIVLTAPIFNAIAGVAGGMVGAIGFAWLGLIVMRLAVGGLVQGIASGVVVWLVMIWGLQPAQIQTSTNGSVQVTKLAWLGWNVALATQGAFGEAMEKIVTDIPVNGALMPSEAILTAAVDRAADQFRETDLARLIVDYNQQCGPDAGVIRGGAVPLEVYHAVGLAGGQGLGMPESEIGYIAAAAKGYEGAVKYLTQQSNILTGTGVRDGIDAIVVSNRRQAGIAALEEENRGFITSSPYLLPKTEYWESVYQNAPAKNNAYLALSDAPFELKPVAWSEEQGGPASQGFAPTNCVEAYKVAQFAAEQSYKALISTGGEASKGQGKSAEAGRISAAVSMQRVINRTMNAGALDTKSTFSQAVGGAVAVTQAIKNEIAWYEQYTLIPAFVGGVGALLWLLLVTAPIFVLVAPVLGVQVFVSWASGVLFCTISIMIAQFLTVGIGVLLTGASIYQAGMAAGWNGTGPELDLIVGLLPMAPGLITVIAPFIATIITGFSIGPLGSAARQAVATTTDAAKGIAQVASMALGARGLMMKESSFAASKSDRAEKAAAKAAKAGGEGGGGGRNGGAAAPSQGQSSGTGSSGSVDGSGAGLAKKASNFGQMQRRLNAQASKMKDVDLIPKKSEE